MHQNLKVMSMKKQERVSLRFESTFKTGLYPQRVKLYIWISIIETTYTVEHKGSTLNSALCTLNEITQKDTVTVFSGKFA